MLIIGRLTDNAGVKQVREGKSVVNFSVAVNDWYKPKGTERGIKTTTFFNCSYWIGTAIAERLKKGSLVELTGHLSVNAYIDKNGEAKGSLNVHVNTIQVHQTLKMETSNSTVAANTVEPAGDLPF